MIRISTFAVALFLFFGPAFQAVNANVQSESDNLIVPEGLVPCTGSDALNTAAARIATGIGAQLLSCFSSKESVEVQKGATAPLEFAFAIRLAGESLTVGDLDALLSTVTKQWKDFSPLSTEFRDDYIARLNAYIRATDSGSGTVASIKPLLVSIERLDANSYSVVSIRSYVFNEDGGQVSIAKVNADAIVLRNGNFIRLTMQRVLTGASDVEKLRADIATWARATEKGRA